MRLDYFLTFDNFELDGTQVDLLVIGNVVFLSSFLFVLSSSIQLCAFFLSSGGKVTVYNSPDSDFSDHFGLVCELFPIQR